MKIDWFEWLTFGTAVTGAVRKISKLFEADPINMDAVKAAIINAWYSAPAPIFDRIPEDKIVNIVNAVFDVIAEVLAEDPNVPSVQ